MKFVQINKGLGNFNFSYGYLRQIIAAVVTFVLAMTASVLVLEGQRELQPHCNPL